MMETKHRIDILASFEVDAKDDDDARTKWEALLEAILTATLATTLDLVHIEVEDISPA